MTTEFPADTTIGDLLRRCALRDPDGVALIDARHPERRWTWEALHGDTVATARRLAASHAPGAVLAVWAPSEPAWVVLELAAALAGVVVQPIDPALDTTAVAAALRRTGAVTLAVGGEDLPRARALAAGLPVLRCTISLGAGPSGPLASTLPVVTPDMAALVLPTSGTTGAPKAARLSHRAVTADAGLVAARMGLQSDDTWLTTMPLHRSGGCATTVVACLAVGATMVCSPNPAANDVLTLMEATGATVLSAFPRALHDLVAAVRGDIDERLRGGGRLRLVQTGGAPVSPALVRSVADAMGARLSVVYGLTEAAPVLTQTDQADPGDDPAASVGRPLPFTQLAIVDRAGGRRLPTGEVGLVLARGPQLMDGYDGDPDATARVLDADGWLRTGDLGWLDDHGRLHVEGRLDDVIERDGHRWLPGPVEQVLARRDGVAEAVVVAAPRGGGGPEVVAFVRGHPGQDLDPAELRAAVAGSCDSRQVPDRIVVVDELPALPSGKVRRHVLRQWAGSPSSPVDGASGRPRALGAVTAGHRLSSPPSPPIACPSLVPRSP